MGYPYIGEHRADLIGWAESCLPVERKDCDSDAEWAAWKVEHPDPITTTGIDAGLLYALDRLALGADAGPPPSDPYEVIELPVWHLKNRIALVDLLPAKGRLGRPRHTGDQRMERERTELRPVAERTQQLLDDNLAERERYPHRAATKRPLKVGDAREKAAEDMRPVTGSSRSAKSIKRDLER
jgi:hypothetical protein